jgi:hypothetical protein
VAGERRFSREGGGGCAGGWDGAWDGGADGGGCGDDACGGDGWDVGGRGASREQALRRTAAVNAASLFSEWSI